MRGLVLGLLCVSVASAQESPPRVAVKAKSKPVPTSKPVPSIWKPLGKSRGGRSIESLKTGTGEFKVLVVGSLIGYDPPATRLVETLATRVVEDAAIIGGFRSVVVRSPNPDGLALKRSVNARNVRIARSFVKNATNREPETQFLIRLLRDYKPHRVVHVTSGSNSTPLVLHNEMAHDVATELAGWLSAKTRPARRFSPIGSMEQFVGESAEVLTLVLPKAQVVADAWPKYGESLLAVLAPSDPIEEWPPPTAWNEKDLEAMKVLRSGQTTEAPPKK